MPKETTSANKQRRIDRQNKFAARRDSEVSENCLKKRGMRQRRREWKKADRKTRGISPSAAGARQFGPESKVAHRWTHFHGRKQIARLGLDSGSAIG